MRGIACDPKLVRYRDHSKVPVKREALALHFQRNPRPWGESRMNRRHLKALGKLHDESLPERLKSALGSSVVVEPAAED